MIMWDLETLQIMGVHLRKQPLLLVYTVKRNESVDLSMNQGQGGLHYNTNVLL